MSSTFYGTVGGPAAAPARRPALLLLAAGAACAGAVAGVLLAATAAPTALYAPGLATPRHTAIAVPRVHPGHGRVVEAGRAVFGEEADAEGDSYLEAEAPAADQGLPSTAAAFRWALLAGCAGALVSAAAAMLGRPQPKGPADAVPLAMMAASGARDYAGDMKKLSPLRDLVLARVAPAEAKTTGGLVLPEVMQTKPTSGDVVAVGPKVTALKGGECILYSKFGVAVTELEVEGQAHILIREADIIGVLPRSPANARDTPELKPLLDKVLVRKDAEPTNQPSGLILQAADADAKYITGEVVAVGGGWTDANGQFHALALQPGQKVLFSKYAGDKLPTPGGPEYVCVAESEVLGVL